MVTTPRQSDDTAGAAREPGLTALAGQLTRELRSLVERLRHFSAARWAAAAPPFPSRAEVAFHLAQVLAAAGRHRAARPAGGHRRRPAGRAGAITGGCGE